MNRLNHLVACLGEECGEVVQVVGKAQRFGLFDHHPKRQATNWVLLRQEVHDTIAVFEMLCDELDRVSDIDRKLIDRKKRRVEKHLLYAENVPQKIGQV